MIEAVIAIVGTFVLAAGFGIVVKLKERLHEVAIIVNVINDNIAYLLSAIDDGKLTEDEVRQIIENLESLVKIIKNLVKEE